MSRETDVERKTRVMKPWAAECCVGCHAISSASDEHKIAESKVDRGIRRQQLLQQRLESSRVWSSFFVIQIPTPAPKRLLPLYLSFIIIIIMLVIISSSFENSSSEGLFDARALNQLAMAADQRSSADLNCLIETPFILSFIIGISSRE